MPCAVLHFSGKRRSRRSSGKRRSRRSARKSSPVRIKKVNGKTVVLKRRSGRKSRRSRSGRRSRRSSLSRKSGDDKKMEERMKKIMKKQLERQKKDRSTDRKHEIWDRVVNLDKWDDMYDRLALYYVVKGSKKDELKIGSKIPADVIYQWVNGGGKEPVILDLQGIIKYHEKHGNRKEKADAEKWLKRIEEDDLYTSNRKPKYLKK